MVFFLDWLYYENKLVLSSVFLSFATSAPDISRSCLQISVSRSLSRHSSGEPCTPRGAPSADETRGVRSSGEKVHDHPGGWLAE
jgi:hypothetical protein